MVLVLEVVKALFSNVEIAVLLSKRANALLTGAKMVIVVAFEVELREPTKL